MDPGGASSSPSIPTSGTSTPSTGPTATNNGSTANGTSQRQTKICVYCGSSAGYRPVHLEAARDLAKAMAAHNIGLVYGGGTIGIMGELAKTLVSLSGPDAVHGIIPEALVRYERDQHYTSTSRSPSTPRSKRASGTSTPVSATSAAGAAAESGPGTGAGTGGGSAKAADKPQSPVPAAVAKLRQEVLSEQQSAAADSDDTYELRVPDEKIFGRTTVVKDMHTRKQMMAREVIDGGPGSGFIALSGGYGTLEELLETCTWNQLGIHNKGICLYNVDGFFDGILAWIRKAVDEGFIKGQNDRIIVQATDAEGAIRALREYKVSNSVLKLSWGNE